MRKTLVLVMLAACIPTSQLACRSSVPDGAGDPLEPLKQEMVKVVPEPERREALLREDREAIMGGALDSKNGTESRT